MTSVADGRRSRGLLETDVKQVTDAYVTDPASVVKDGLPLTPHRIAKTVLENTGSDKPPSTGAVSNVLKSWKEIGFAEISEGPTSFVDYTAEGRAVGRVALKERARDAKKAAKAAAAGPVEQTEPKPLEGPVTGGASPEPEVNGSVVESEVFEVPVEFGANDFSGFEGAETTSRAHPETW